MRGLDTSFQVPCSFAGAASPTGAAVPLLVDEAGAVGGLADAPVVPVAAEPPPQPAKLAANSTPIKAMYPLEAFTPP